MIGIGRRIAVLAAAFTLSLCGGAAAQTTIIAPAGSPFQAWADEAKVPTPEVTITVVEVEGEDACPSRAGYSYEACTVPSESTIWFSTRLLGSEFERQVFLHELGHNADADLATERIRARFEEIMGRSGPWVLEGEPAPYGPDELFADVYAQCAVKPYVQPGFHGESLIFNADPKGGAKRHNQVCHLLAHL